MISSGAERLPFFDRAPGLAIRLKMANSFLTINGNFKFIELDRRIAAFSDQVKGKCLPGLWIFKIKLDVAFFTGM